MTHTHTRARAETSWQASYDFPWFRRQPERSRSRNKQNAHFLLDPSSCGTTVVRRWCTEVVQIKIDRQDSALEPTTWVECDCESCPVPDSKRAPVSSGGGPDTTLLRRRSRLLGSVGSLRA